MKKWIIILIGGLVTASADPANERRQDSITAQLGHPDDRAPTPPSTVGLRGSCLPERRENQRKPHHDRRQQCHGRKDQKALPVDDGDLQRIRCIRHIRRIC